MAQKNLNELSKFLKEELNITQGIFVGVQEDQLVVREIGKIPPLEAYSILSVAREIMMASFMQSNILSNELFKVKS